MLISFTLQNWMSFRDETTFSMVASRERQHGDRVPALKKYRTRILPITAMYGGNASGKTNFFLALNFAKALVVNGTPLRKHIPVNPFRLNDQGIKQPSRFTFELLIDELIYEFSFAVTGSEVLEEKLVEITSTSEKVLYDRRDGKPHFYKSLAGDPVLKINFDGTQDNQLFLHNSVSQKIDRFLPIYNWFKDTLELVAPDSRFESFEMFSNENNSVYSAMEKILPELDTGIESLGVLEMPLKNAHLPEEFKNEIEDKIEEGMTGSIVATIGSRTAERYHVTREDGNLIARKLATYHLAEGGSSEEFEISEESDGTQRLLDLIPAFIDLWDPTARKVYIIDEIDRSLHPVLIQKLLEEYLANCSRETRSQLLFTTHNTQLLNQQLLRRDEIWLSQRNSAGASILFCLYEFEDARHDSDIRKSYLQGRMGGIPNIFSGFAEYAQTDSRSVESSKIS